MFSFFGGGGREAGVKIGGITLSAKDFLALLEWPYFQ